MVLGAARLVFMSSCLAEDTHAHAKSLQEVAFVRFTRDRAALGFPQDFYCRAIDGNRVLGSFPVGSRQKECAKRVCASAGRRSISEDGDGESPPPSTQTPVGNVGDGETAAYIEAENVTQAGPIPEEGA